jgi:3-phosphoglycerate kinase
MGLDIGPDSIKSFSQTLDTTKTVIWNGPMGVFEFEKFAAGTDVSKLPCTYTYPSQNFRSILAKCTAACAGDCQEVG